jgi:PAS domain S-box-containing protein
MSVIDFFTRRASDVPGSRSPREADIPLAFLGAIVESSDDAIVGTTLDGHIISWNAAATRMYGHQSADVIGRPAELLVPPDLRDEERRIFEKVRRGERVEHFETTRIAHDGRRIPVSLSVSPVLDAGGLVIAASEIARDIEQQKRAERASAQLGAIVESSDDAVVSKDLNGIIQSWNAGAERIFGYSRAEIVGRHVTTIIPPELHDEERTIIERIRAGERVEHFDTVRVSKDGSRIPVSLTVSPIRDPEGRIIGASKIARDISERRRAERDLLEGRRRLAAEAAALARLNEASVRLWHSRSLAAGLDEVLRTMRALTGAEKGNVQFLNPTRNTLTIVAHAGFEPDFLATFEHLPANDARAACGRALTAGQPVVIEDVLVDKAYAAFHDVARAAGYRSVIAVPLFAADGQRLGAISMHFPSPHRPTEAEMRRLQLYCRQVGDFIQRIRLENALRQRESELQDADRRKDEFLALLAHELRNPLAPIRYAIATARKEASTGEQRAHALDVLDRQAAYMSRLLDDLLDISRITRGILELKKEPTSLESVIATSVEAAQPFIDARRHLLTVTLPDRPVWLVADAVRLSQVFSNLLINAAKYTPEDGQVELTAVNGHDGLVVTIRDNGAGIAPEMLPKLFTLFSQDKSLLDHAGGGLGVGLAMVRGLVELHRGTVQARSAGPGRGSEFVVRLPVERVPAADELAEPEPPAEPKATLRVLVVDDNRDAADSCATLLELSGHRALTAYNGTRALQLGESFLPHVMLLDIGLPDLNGYEVARRVRASDWGAGLCLVAVTGWGKEEDRVRAREAGFDHHMTKPVAPGAIESLVECLAERAAATAH